MQEKRQPALAGEELCTERMSLWQREVLSHCKYQHACIFAEEVRNIKDGCSTPCEQRGSRRLTMIWMSGPAGRGTQPFPRHTHNSLGSEARLGTLRKENPDFRCTLTGRWKWRRTGKMFSMGQTPQFLGRQCFSAACSWCFVVGFFFPFFPGDVCVCLLPDTLNHFRPFFSLLLSPSHFIVPFPFFCHLLSHETLGTPC